MGNTIVPENIHLIDVQWIKESPVINIGQNDLLQRCDFQITYSMMHNLEKEIVKIGIFVDMISDKNYPTKQDNGGNYEIDFIFKIDHLNSHYQLIEGNPLFDGMFVGTLLSISYSTTRGMLLTTWRNSFMEKVILPIISVQEFIKNKRIK